MDQFEDIKSLGRGAYANVRLVRRIDNDELMVIKKFHVALRDLTPKERLEIAQEIKVLAHLRHPNIVEFRDHFVEDDFTHILMEFATGGTLYRMLVNRDGELLPEARIWEMFVQIASAIRYVHARNILHRDLKSENIMLSGIDERVIKLGDFGIAKILGSQADQAATIVGTPHSLSPELVQGAGYDQKSDVWALGCVLYEMCALRKPFDASNVSAIIFSIMRNSPAAIPDIYSAELKDMVKLLLRANPADRPSLTDLEAMPIVQHHMQRFRAEYRELEAARGLPPSSVTAGMPAAVLSARPSGAAGDAAGAEGSAAGAVGSTTTRFTPGQTTMRSPGGGVGPDGSPIMSPSHQRTIASQAVAFEREMRAAVEELSRDAETVSIQASSALIARINEVHTRLETGPPVNGSVWEMMGRTWAECGPVGFNKAIIAYRKCLRAKSASASLYAMEQLGNLLVRRAQQVWAKARAGDPEGALKEAQMALEGNSKTILSKITGKAAKGPKAIATKIKRASDAAGVGDAMDAATGTVEAEPLEDEDPPWRQAAAALMFEGLAFIERLCSFGPTPERRSLLGSAYKRRAWTGLGQSRKDDLRQAAANYAAAHEIEMEEGAEYPSPYARLNQLTFELLAGSGTEDERVQLLAGIKEAETWANFRRAENPADVWLWVQVVDALCLRYLLADEEVTQENVIEGYVTQFAFGASQRVKSSVMDQLSFLQEVLQGRVVEVEAEAQEKAAHASAVSDVSARVSAGTPLPAGASAPDVSAREDAGAAAAPRRTSVPESEDSVPIAAAAALAGKHAESSSQTGGTGRPLRRVSQLSAIPETAALMAVRAWLISVLEKVRDLHRRLEKHVGDADAAAAAAAAPKAVVVLPPKAAVAAPAPVKTAGSNTAVLSPRAVAAFAHSGTGTGSMGRKDGTASTTSLASAAATPASVSDAATAAPAGRAPRRGSSTGDGPNPFARGSAARFESSRRRSSATETASAVTAASSSAAPLSPASVVEPSPGTASRALKRQGSTKQAPSGPNPFAKSTPNAAKFRGTKRDLGEAAAPLRSPVRLEPTPEENVTVVQRVTTARGDAPESARSPPGRGRVLAPLPEPSLQADAYLPSAILSPTPLTAPSAGNGFDTKTHENGSGRAAIGETRQAAALPGGGVARGVGPMLESASGESAPAAGLVMRPDDLVHEGNAMSNTMKSTTSSGGRDTRRFNAPPALVLTSETSHVIGAAGIVAANGSMATADVTGIAHAGAPTTKGVDAQSVRPTTSSSGGELSARANLESPEPTHGGARVSGAFAGSATAATGKRSDIATPSGVTATVIPSVRSPWGSHRSVEMAPVSSAKDLAAAAAAADASAAAGHSGVLATPNGGLALGHPTRRGSNAAVSTPSQAAHGDVVSSMFSSPAVLEATTSPSGSHSGRRTGDDSGMPLPTGVDARSHVPDGEPPVQPQQQQSASWYAARPSRSKVGAGTPAPLPAAPTPAPTPATGSGTTSMTPSTVVSTASPPLVGPPPGKRTFLCC